MKRSDIDRTLEETMAASDPPQFSDPDKKLNPVEAEARKIEGLETENFPASVSKKLSDAAAIKAAFEQNKISEREALEGLQKIKDDPEVSKLLEN